MTGDEVVVRPVPSRLDLATVESYHRGKRNNGMTSPSYWDVGALIADDEGAAIRGADGTVRRLPPLPCGSVVLKTRIRGANTGATWLNVYVVSGPGPTGRGLLSIHERFGFYEAYLNPWAERLGLVLAQDVPGEFALSYHCDFYPPMAWLQDSEMRTWSMEQPVGWRALLPHRTRVRNGE